MSYFYFTLLINLYFLRLFLKVVFKNLAFKSEKLLRQSTPSVRFSSFMFGRTDEGLKFDFRESSHLLRILMGKIARYFFSLRNGNFDFYGFSNCSNYDENLSKILQKFKNVHLVSLKTKLSIITQLFYHLPTITTHIQKIEIFK